MSNPVETGQAALSRRNFLRLALSVPLMVGGSTATLVASGDNLRQHFRIAAADEPNYYHLNADTGEREARWNFDVKTMDEVRAKKENAFNTMERNFKVIFVSVPAVIAGGLILSERDKPNNAT